MEGEARSIKEVAILYKHTGFERNLSNDIRAISLDARSGISAYLKAPSTSMELDHLA
jgi:hypothetical protein